MGYYGYEKIAEANCPCGKHKITVYECGYEQHSDYVYPGDGSRIAYYCSCDKYRLYTFGYSLSTVTVNISYDEYKNDKKLLDRLNTLESKIKNAQDNLKKLQLQKYYEIIRTFDRSKLPKYYQQTDFDYFNNHYNNDSYLSLLLFLLFNEQTNLSIDTLSCIISVLYEYTSIKKLENSIVDQSFLTILNKYAKIYKITDIKQLCDTFWEVVFRRRYRTNSIKTIRYILEHCKAIYVDFHKINNMQDRQLNIDQKLYKKLYDMYYDRQQEYSEYLAKNTIKITYKKVDDNDNFDNPDNYGFHPGCRYGSEQELNQFLIELAGDD